MKTFVMAAVAVMVGSAAMGQGSYAPSLRAGGYGAADFGACPDGFCGTQPGCTDGSCGVASCADAACGVAGCPSGACGPTGCPSGNCGVVGHRHAVARSAAVGYPAQVRPLYGAGVSASCPNGNCAQVPVVSHAVGYRGYPTAAANCPNGRCGTVPAPRYPVRQAPRVNFLGMTW